MATSHKRMRAKACRDGRRLMHEASAAALLVHKIQASRGRVVEPLPGCHPCPGERLARPSPALGWRTGVRRVTAFVCEQVAQIFVTREPDSRLRRRKCAA